MPYAIGIIVLLLVVGLFAGGASIQGLNIQLTKVKDCLTSLSTSAQSEGPTNVIIKAADQVRCVKALESIARSAEIYSVRAGGGGDCLFPTNAFTMSKNMPPHVAESIEGCYSSPVKPLGGYVFRYVVEPSRMNYRCTAVPANGYTGVVFSIQKDMQVVADDNSNVSGNNMETLK